MDTDQLSSYLPAIAVWLTQFDLKAQIAGGVEPKAAMQLLQERLARIPNVLRDPPPVVEILEFYWQVYFDTDRTIRESFGEAGFPAPELRYHVTGRE